MNIHRPPTHDLCIAPRDRGSGFQTIGVGWLNDEGGISIKLNRGIVLSWRDMTDNTVYVFPRQPSADKEKR